MLVSKIHPRLRARVAQTRQKRERQLSLLKEDLIVQNQKVASALDKLHSKLGFEPLQNLKQVHERIIVSLQNLDAFDESPTIALSAFAEISARASLASDRICSAYADELNGRLSQLRD